MPVHDWTRVSPGTWHAFHLSWISEIQESLNGGLLPPTYYAQAEQIAGPFGPDVLTLQEPETPPTGTNGTTSRSDEAGGVAVATAPPRVRITAEAESRDYARKRRAIVIRHTSGDRIIALLELVSPGNKSSQQAINSFVEKAQASIFRGYHLLIVDLFPPGPRDPNGLHPAIWREFSDEPYVQPANEPLTLAAYSAGERTRAYIEPTAVGRVLIDMPLFLTSDTYVNVPLEATYQGAYRGVPRKWKEVLEAPPS
jgi:hypothetical protein